MEIIKQVTLYSTLWEAFTLYNNWSTQRWQYKTTLELLPKLWIKILSTRTCWVKLINYWSFSSPSLSLVPHPNVDVHPFEDWKRFYEAPWHNVG